MQSTNIGSNRHSVTASGYSLQRQGVGRIGADFTWSGPIPATYNRINTNQIFNPSNVVPLPLIFSFRLGSNYYKPVNNAITLVYIVSQASFPASFTTSLASVFRPFGVVFTQIAFTQIYAGNGYYISLTVSPTPSNSPSLPPSSQLYAALKQTGSVFVNGDMLSISEVYNTARCLNGMLSDYTGVCFPSPLPTVPPTPSAPSTVSITGQKPITTTTVGPTCSTTTYGCCGDEKTPKQSLTDDCCSQYEFGCCSNGAVKPSKNFICPFCPYIISGGCSSCIGPLNTACAWNNMVVPGSPQCFPSSTLTKQATRQRLVH